MVRDISASYNSLTEWNSKDPSSCRAAKRFGIYEELKNTKNIRRESTPQRMIKFIFDKLLSEDGIYNCRSVITPFEIDVYYDSRNFGIEYNGHAFHFGRYYDENREYRKRQKEEEMSNIWLFHVNEDRHYNYNEYDSFIKKYIIDNLTKINDWCKTNITPTEIDNIDLQNIDDILTFNWDEVLKLIDSYECGSEFRKNHRSLYHTIISKNRKDILNYINNKTVNYYKQIYDNYNDELYNLSITHLSYDHFYKDKTIYGKCNKRKLIPKIKKWFLDKEIENSDEFITAMIDKHNTYGDFYRNFEDLYYAEKRGLQDTIKTLFYTKNKDNNLIPWFKTLSIEEQYEYLRSNYTTSTFIVDKRLYDYYNRRKQLPIIRELLSS